MKVYNKALLACLLVFSGATTLCAQVKATALPAKIFVTLRDSTTQADVVYYSPATTSLSIEGRNVHLFNLFLENKTALDTIKKADGFVMWLIDGREFIKANFYLGVKESYFKFQKDSLVFINKITEQGAATLKQQKH
ncbi:MAG: hypothetical protein M9931_01505 [Chitinophagales bacterium]|nr:hypothetical protein [Chitinophagales bacterium]MCO5279713.1 hypothetical protein [Chitinophagales bacterium]HRN93628.1 hypothetical protein [Chitinophagales bacterium]HRP40159.1 hypothetical protein [Chitinophagales bacterium]